MGTPNILPLSWPPSGRPPVWSCESSLIPYMIVMVIGGTLALLMGSPVALLAAALICGGLFTFQTRSGRNPAVLHVREQLLTRPECLQLWGTDPHRLELAAVLCNSLAHLKKWPNAHFIPEDPMDIAFYEVSGIDVDLEVLEVGSELTKATGRKINWIELSDIRKVRTLTLSDLLDASLEQEKNGPNEGAVAQ